MSCLTDTLAVSAAAQGSAVLDTPVKTEVCIPQTLSEVDNGKLLGFGAELAEDHPVRSAKLCQASAGISTDTCACLTVMPLITGLSKYCLPGSLWLAGVR